MSSHETQGYTGPVVAFRTHTVTAMGSPITISIDASNIRRVYRLEVRLCVEVLDPDDFSSEAAIEEPDSMVL